MADLTEQNLVDAVNAANGLLQDAIGEVNAKKTILDAKKALVATALTNKNRCSQSNSVYFMGGNGQWQAAPKPTWILDDVTRYPSISAINDGVAQCIAYINAYSNAVAVKNVAQGNYDTAINVKNAKQSEYNTSVQNLTAYQTSQLSVEDQVLLIEAEGAADAAAIEAAADAAATGSEAQTTADILAAAEEVNTKNYMIFGGIFIVVIVVIGMVWYKSK